MNSKRYALREGILKGTLIVSLGGLAAKFIGALYRIPLTSLLKADGLGIYQTVFPIYSVLLVFSSSGIPSALSKLVSQRSDGDAVFHRAIRVFLPLGILGSAIMAFGSPLFASWQGNPDAKYAYIALSPSVAIVSLLACVRGYFQGKSNMKPTAVSQIIEQFVKAITGLTLCYSFRENFVAAGAAACAAVTVSEIIAAAYLHKKVRLDGVNVRKTTTFSTKTLLATVLPVTLSAVLLPLARTYDSFTVVNVLKKYTGDAAKLYGVYTGSVESVVGMPIALCYGAAVSTLPIISRLLSSGDHGRVAKKTCDALVLTLFSSTLFAAALALFSSPIIDVLFGGLSDGEKSIAAALLALSSFNVPLLSLVQTSAAILIAYGKPQISCLSLSIGLAVKSILQIFLLQNPKINIFGVLYSDIACYSFAVFFDLVYIIIYNFKLRKARDETRTCIVGNSRRRYIR